MANPAHLSLIKQGIEVWNKWRTNNSGVITDLTEADLNGTNLSGAKLTGVSLVGADLRGADLSEADLCGTDLTLAGLAGANLTRSLLVGAALSITDLSKANLTNADLTGANLFEATLRSTQLEGTDFSKVWCGYSTFADLDLSTVKHLEQVVHLGPSTIGIDTLFKSNGNIPREFLDGCGVPEIMITYAKSLINTAIEYYSCFISYSTIDNDFANQLKDRMRHNGLQVWFAPEDIKGGKKIYEQLYEAIRYHDKLVLVLSNASMKSGWVQTEIKRARKHEREEKRRKLFPISLIPYNEIQKWELFDSDEGRDLAQEIREYYIPDFSDWKNYDSFNIEVEKLLNALQADDD